MLGVGYTNNITHSGSIEADVAIVGIYIVRECNVRCNTYHVTEPNTHTKSLVDDRLKRYIGDIFLYTFDKINTYPLK